MEIFDQYIRLDTLCDEIMTMLKRYKQTGHVTERNIIVATMDCLKKFGNNIMEKFEDLVPIVDYKGVLPGNQYRIRYMVKCKECPPPCKPCDFKSSGAQPNTCNEDRCDSRDMPTVQRFFKWVETNKNVDRYNLCDECNKEIYTVVGCQAEYVPNIKKPRLHFNDVEFLRFGKSINRGMCLDSCKTCHNPNSPYHVEISGNQLRTNFRDGTIFIDYYGIPVDEDGKLLIINSPNGRLYEHLKYYVLSKLLEYIRIDDEQARQLHLDYYQLADATERAAIVDSVGITFTHDVYRKLINQNRDRYEQYFNNGYRGVIFRKERLRVGE